MEHILRINADNASLYLLLMQIKPPFKCVCPAKTNLVTNQISFWEKGVETNEFTGHTTITGTQRKILRLFSTSGLIIGQKQR
ncbi:MAG: hypothetical protein RL711_297 [Bacteroidota bacterium]